MNTISDRWPNPDDMPDEVKEALQGLYELGQAEQAEVDANPHHFTKGWWQVDTTPHGAVTRVWLNKISGSAAGLWTFEPTIDENGHAIISVQQSKHVDALSAQPVGFWHVPADTSDEMLSEELSDLVGRRSAKAAVARLRRNR